MEDQTELLQDTRTQRSVSPQSHISPRQSGASQVHGHIQVDIESGTAPSRQSTLLETTDSDELGPTRNGSKHTPATTHKARLENCWWMELSAILISILSFFCIVLVLRIHEGRSLPDWPLSITINSLVSVFSTIMGMTLLVPLTEGISQAKWHWFQNYHPLSDMEVYDHGSRGPWGALKMLWIVRWR